MSSSTAVRTLRTALGSSPMRRALFGYGAFSVAELAVWVSVLIYAHDVGGANAVAVMAVAQLVPAVFVAPLGATLADRLSRLHALTFAYGALAASLAAVGVLLVQGAPFWAVTTGAAVSNCAVTLCRPAHFAALPRIAGTPEEVIAANSASSTLDNLGVFLGPALVVAVVAGGSVTPVLWILTALMAGAALGVGTCRGVVEAPTATPESLFRGALEGVRQLRAVPGATALLLLVGVQFVVVGSLDVLSVVFPIEVLGQPESASGVLFAASGIGGVIGAVATVTLIGKQRLAGVLIISAALIGIPLAAIALVDLVGWVALLLALSGVARSYFDVAGRSILQRAVPPAALARVFGLQESALMAGLAVGAAITPVLLAWLGPRGAFVAIGALPVVLTLVAIPALRKLDVPVGPDSAAALLRRTTLFAPLPMTALERLASGADRVSFPADSDIVVQGEAGDAFYLVVAGEVVVRRDRVEVSRLGPGDFFGEVALLRDQPRNATVATLGDVEVVRIGREPFLTAVTGSRPAAIHADQLATQRS